MFRGGTFYGPNVKLLAFDLDGTLFEAKQYHRDAFIRAVSEIVGYTMPVSDHDTKYCGLPTNKKLDMLVGQGFKLTAENIEDIKELKQEYTRELLERHVGPNNDISNMLDHFRNDRFILACVTNSITKTLETILKKMNIRDSFDYLISNECVFHPKPHAEPYIRVMVAARCQPHETLCFEDNQYGVQSVLNSGANLMKVEGPRDLSIDKIVEKIKEVERFNKEATQ